VDVPKPIGLKAAGQVSVLDSGYGQAFTSYGHRRKNPGCAKLWISAIKMINRGNPKNFEFSRSISLDILCRSCEVVLGSLKREHI
jgi:hypothetical protein